MKRNKEQPIGKILNVFLDGNPNLQQHLLEERLVRSWNMIMGPYVSRYTSNIYIHDGTLFVSIKSAVLRSELLINREQLIKKLNDFCGEAVITQMVIR